MEVHLYEEPKGLLNSNPGSNQESALRWVMQRAAVLPRPSDEPAGTQVEVLLRVHHCPQPMAAQRECIHHVHWKLPEEVSPSMQVTTLHVTTF